MNTFSDSVLTALNLVTSFDPALWVVVTRSLAVSATACLLAYGVGVALGAWLAVSRFRGRGLVLVGLNTLRAKTAHKHPLGTLWAGPVGTAIGLVEMLFGTAGPLVVAWLSRRLADAQQIRASTPMIIAAAASTVLAGMAWDGQLASDLLWQRWTGLIGVAILGVWLGHRLAHHVPMARLRQIISTLLVVSGLMLAWGALR